MRALLSSPLAFKWPSYCRKRSAGRLANQARASRRQNPLQAKSHGHGIAIESRLDRLASQGLGLTVEQRLGCERRFVSVQATWLLPWPNLMPAARSIGRHCRAASANEGASDRSY